MHRRFQFSFNHRRPRHSVAPPLTQRGTCTGPCTQFRPPLPTSPIVGEGDLEGNFLNSQF